MKNEENLLGQSLALHILLPVLSPKHVIASIVGVGLLHNLWRVETPSPHADEQTDQSDHKDQLASFFIAKTK